MKAGAPPATANLSMTTDTTELNALAALVAEQRMAAMAAVSGGLEANGTTTRQAVQEYGTTASDRRPPRRP